MKRLTVLGSLALAAATGGACSEPPAALPMRSLERSGEVSFLCVTDSGEGRDIDSCPDRDEDDGEDRRLLALVTQTLRGEVAVIDLSEGTVVDVDPSSPGYGFLAVGAMPVDIVSTPGGEASFVGVAEPGKEGIFALPSSCLWAPAEDERARDLTSWPACALPSVPGAMAVLVDPADDDGRVRASCDGRYSAPEAPLAAGRAVCPADLTRETVVPGRRKLSVALPDEGRIAILDAQTLLDREPGTYDPCEVERWVELGVGDSEGPAEQRVPEDLQAEGCVAPTVTYEPPVGEFVSQPSDFAQSGGILYVADFAAPVLHRLSVSDPCSPVELPPLLPRSYTSPGRVVTTKAVAVSPLTTQGERFVYAIDDLGDVMVFDVSAGTSDRVPLVRAGTPLLPPNLETPDRISFASPVRDLEFVFRDEPQVDPVTGVALVGVTCDPDPFVSDSLGAEYRTGDDYDRGARPHQLRGVFAFLMLANGEVAIIDVEDFDAPCRRPARSNPSTDEDFHGCSGDTVDAGVWYTEGGEEGAPPTVSDELSCRVFDRHRARSSTFVKSSNGTGVSGPSLRSMPTLRDEDGSSLVTDDSEEGRVHPKLLAVEYPAPTDSSQTLPVEVHVGTALYSSEAGATEFIDVDPRTADQNSVALLYRQPRAFYPSQEVTAVYEGTVLSERPAGLLRLTNEADGLQLLRDDGARFCDRGVEDEALAREIGAGMGLSGARLSAFVAAHADYLQITSPIVDEDDRYWSSTASVGYTCGDQGEGNGYYACELAFGTTEQLRSSRDLRIAEAYQGYLLVEPREPAREDLADMLYCCFGAGQVLSYLVRAGNQWVVSDSASGFQSDVVANADGRCVRDCRPLNAHHHGRALEVATEDQVCNRDSGECTQLACVFPASDPLASETASPTLPGPIAPDSACVFQNLTHRFAVYRGDEPSERGMTFTWEVDGGFVPLSASLVNTGGSTSVLPQSITYVPQIASLAVTDGAQKGLTFISLDNVSPTIMFY